MTECWSVSVTPQLLSAAAEGVMATVVVGDEAPIVVPSGAAAIVATVPSGEVQVTTSAPGFETVSGLIELRANAERRLALWPAGDVVVSGEVRDGFGQPAAGVDVALRVLPPRDSGDVFRALTAGDGSFSISGLPAADVELTLSAAGSDSLHIGPLRVLSDTTLDFALVPEDEEATIDSLGRSCAAGPAGSLATAVGGSWWLLGLLGLRRRWR
ncbi:MAG: hypothetical protein ACI81R_000666 [Bradymonadia bacterium]|jgi:hypothetical protein